MSNLTDLLPAGAGGKQVSFVASGTIGDGVTVALNSDGTVSTVGETTESSGSSTLFESGTTIYISSAYDQLNSKVVIAYCDNSNGAYGTAVVGSISGTSISFGTPVVFESANTTFTSVGFDSGQGKIVIAYRDGGNSGYGTCVIGTVSGSSISFGSAVVFENASMYEPSVVYDEASAKTVILYRDDGNNNYLTGIVGTVSGTSITFGTPTVADSVFTTYVSSTFDSGNNKIVCAYYYYNVQGKAVVATVSGTSISFGTPLVFRAGTTSYVKCCYNSVQQKTIISYIKVSSSNQSACLVATVSGTSISFGAEATISSNTAYLNSVYNSTSDKVIVSYTASNDQYIRSASVSGDVITYDPAILLNNGTIYWSYLTTATDSDKSVVAYQDQGASSYGYANVYNPTYSNSSNFIGISDAAISDTASGSVTIKGGISTNVTGLTPNATYYVQSDGSLSTTVSDVLAGKALSSTSINLDYTS